MTTPAQPPGFLRTVRTGLRDALRSSFEYYYPEQDAAGGAQPPFVSLAYPVRRAEYPGVWADFEVSLLQTVGLDHTETDSTGAALTRWRFQGYAVFTVIALNDNECDLIWDQVVALAAWAAQSDYASTFRQAVEGSPLVSMTVAPDTVDPRGQNAAPGTPWQTDEIVYERGLALKVIGEFTTNPLSQVIVPLREIIVTATDSEAPDDSSNPFTLTIR